MRRTGRYYWAWQGKVFVTSDEHLKPGDVLALISESENRRRLRLQRAHDLQTISRLNTGKVRKPIPNDVKVAVWQRDNGRCAECGSNEALEFDRIIPLAMGGANTMRNLQLLCETCNRRKGMTLG